MKRIYSLAAAVLFLVCNCIAQKPASPTVSNQQQAANTGNWVTMMQDGHSNFYDIQKAFKSTWAKKEAKLLSKLSQKKKKSGAVREEEEEMPGGYLIYKRWENFWKSRVYPSGQFPNPSIARDEFENWKSTHAQSQNYNPKHQVFSVQAVSNWSSLGPGTVPTNGGAGRISCVRFDPTNSNIIYAGACAGGLWKSTNGGTSWATTTDNLQVLGVSDVVVDPSNTNIIYIATGDGDAGDTYSVGVLKSTDGGATWNSTGLSFAVNQSYIIRKLIMHPTNDSILLASTNGGVYRTTNAGSTWTQVLAGSYRDLVFNTGNSTIVYAGGYGGYGFYKSTNTGASFSPITSGLPSASSTQRIAIGVTANDATYVYLLISNNSDYGLLGVYRSTDSGTTFTTQLNATTITPTTPNLLGWNTDGQDAGGQGWYDLCILVNPTNKNDVYTGGVNQWHSTNGGVSWSILSYWAAASGTSNPPYVHADVHSLGFLPGSSTTLFSGNDGGVFKSTNNGSTWTDLSSGLVVTEMYRLSASATNANLTLSGNQDNGTTRLSSGSWAEVDGGDGMQCIIDYSNANNMYAEFYYGQIDRSTNGGSSFSGIVSAGGTVGTVNENGDWVTPYIINPVTHTTLLVGKSQVYQSTNSGTSWTTLGSISGGSGSIIALAYAPSSTTTIYAAWVNALFVTTNGGTSWTNITSGLPTASANITYIAVDPANPARVWVTFSGYSSGNKVFFSNNTGSSWSNFSGTLPNLPVDCIVYQNGISDALYIGTDVGVYYRDGSLSDWTGFMTGLPNVIVNDLSIQYSSGKIRAASYGRGMWESSLNSVPTNTITTGTISPLAYCAGATVSVPFTVTGTYNAGNVFTAQLSNGSGSFASPVSIGTLSSTTSGTISATLPANTSSASGYRIRVVSSNPVVTGSDNGSNISINAKPSPTASSNTPVCTGNSVNLSSSGGASYAWSGPNSFSSTVQNPIITGSTTAASGIYTVTVTNASGCTATASATVTVNAKPNPTASNNSPVCAGSNLNLSSLGGTSYSWSGPSSFTSTTQNPIITGTATAATGAYTVTVSNASGCTATATTTATVNAKPTPTAGNNSPVCAGTNLNLSGTGGTSYAWNGPNSFSSTTQNPIISGSTTAATGSYTVIVTNASGCTVTATTSVTVNANPTAVAGSNSPVCSGSAVNLSGSGGITYAWTGPNGFNSTTQNPAINNSSSTNSGTYSLIVTDNNGCTGSATTNVTVNNCTGATLNLTAFLQGFYISTNTMITTLYNLGLSTDSTATDSITINLWLPTHLTNSFPDYSVKTILHKNGTAAAAFSSATVGNSYYIAIKHRNTVETWSSNPVAFSVSTSYSFSSAVTQAFSNGINSPMKNMGDGTFAFFSGDDNQDGTIDAGDMAITDNDASRFAFGYNRSDCTGDGATDVTDLAVIDNNAQLALFYARP